MKFTQATIDEARRLAQQAEEQAASQLEMIERMKRSGLSTDVAEEALRIMQNIAEEMHARFKSMTGSVKAD
jgi:hypothetical protein